MKKSAIPASIIGLLIAAPLFAESQFERDLVQLKREREKALSAAVDPINRRFQTAFEQLLRRATQANDLAAAVKVKDELKNGDLGAKLPPEGAPKVSAIQKALPGEWTWVSSEKTTWGTFFANGTFDLIGKMYLWKVTSDGVVNVTADKKTASFRLSEDLQTLTGTDFAGKPLQGSRR